MAVVKLTIPDDLLESPRTPEELADDVRLAVLMFWLARGMLRRQQLPSDTLSTKVEVQPPKETERKRDRKEVLLAMPDVGDDTIFERTLNYGRQDPQWDS